MERDSVRFVGVDLAKKSMEVCVLAEGMEGKRSSFSTDTAGRAKLCTALRKTDVIAVEACALAFVLERQLRREVGCRVHVLNPGKLAVIWNSTRKTGKDAAHELAPYVMSVPGVGPGVAAAFPAYVGDGSRFSSPAQVANYVGLVPRIDCSGETNRYGQITKDGCRAIRGVILQVTWSLIRCKEGGRLKTKFFLLSERRGKTRSAVALAGRMVGLMWILVTRHEFYADAPKEMLRMKFRQYGLKSEGWESIVA